MVACILKLVPVEHMDEQLIYICGGSLIILKLRIKVHEIGEATILVSKLYHLTLVINVNPPNTGCVL